MSPRGTVLCLLFNISLFLGEQVVKGRQSHREVIGLLRMHIDMPIGLK